MAGKRGAAARAVRHNLMALVQKALFIYGFERPPFGFYIVIFICNIRMLHIGPVTHAVAHLFPFGLVFPNGFLALGNERLHAVGFYLFFAVKPQHFFNFQFNRQPVRIPAGLAQHVVALHGAVAGDNVLHGAGEYVAYVRLAVCRGWAVVKGIGGPALSQLAAFLKYAVLLPELEDLLLPVHKVKGCGDFGIHSIAPFALFCIK